MRYLSPLGKLVFGVSFLALLALVGLFTLFYKPSAAPADYKNISYTIDGKQIVLRDGVSEVPQDNSSAKIVTKYFGNEVRHDLNDDGREDVVFLLTQTAGGSGTFYYVVGAIQNADGGYSGTDGVLLGDRIAPQTTEMSQNPKHKNVVVVNYADRAPGEPMTANPSIGKSIWLKLDPATMQFGEVAQNFEGESDAKEVKASIGETVSALDVSLTPKELVSDSRCPKDVQCIWAGTVQVKVHILSGLGPSDMTFELGKSITTEAEMITLTAVEPEQKSAGVEIPLASYRFTFAIRKR